MYSVVFSKQLRHRVPLLMIKERLGEDKKNTSTNEQPSPTPSQGEEFVLSFILLFS